MEIIRQKQEMETNTIQKNEASWRVLTNRGKLTKILLMALVCLFTVHSYGQTWQIGYPNAADITATLSNGTLTVSGTGAMQDWGWGGNGEMPPWWDTKKESVTSVIINNGITTIGFYAFIDCLNLVSVNIGKDVNYIRSCAFWDCRSLSEIRCNNPTPPNI